MKTGKSIHEIFVFATPKMISVYFDFLKNKVRKVVGITSLLVMGDDVPNLASESHMFDSNLAPIYPKVKERKKDEAVKIIEPNSQPALNDSELKLGMGLKLKSFGKNQKKNQSSKSCIIDKKVS